MASRTSSNTCPRLDVGSTICKFGVGVVMNIIIKRVEVAFRVWPFVKAAKRAFSGSIRVK